jgi:hypothetical protein
MRSDKDLLAILEYAVGQAEGVDFLYEGEFNLTGEEIEYIRKLADTVEGRFATFCNECIEWHIKGTPCVK